jgi:hypothetical protein
MEEEKEIIPDFEKLKEYKQKKIELSTKKDIINLLVIDNSTVNNYYKLFSKLSLNDGTKIKIEQCTIFILTKKVVGKI